MVSVKFMTAVTVKDVNKITLNGKACTKQASKIVGAARFELTTSWSQTKRDTGLRYAPILFKERKDTFNAFKIASVS